jgi:hypothetical protein
MAEIVKMDEWRKRARDSFTEEILQHDGSPDAGAKADRLIDTLNTLIRDTPMGDEQKLVVVWTKLVELLAAVEDEKRRNLYVNRITTLLNRDIVEAARTAFAEF